LLRVDATNDISGGSFEGLPRVLFAAVLQWFFVPWFVFFNPAALGAFFSAAIFVPVPCSNMSAGRPPSYFLVSYVLLSDHSLFSSSPPHGSFWCVFFIWSIFSPLFPSLAVYDFGFSPK